jgi:hypothetical protein
MEPQLVTKAEYARHRNVTRQAIGKAVEAGKVVLVEKDGKFLVDLVASDLKMGANVARILADEPIDDDDEQRGGIQPSGLTAAKTATEQYKTQLAALDLEQRLGKLRPVDEIIAGAQLCAEALVRAISRMPGRADELTARVQKEGVAGARAFLRDLARELRRSAADEFAKIATGKLPAPVSDDDDAAGAEQ